MKKSFFSILAVISMVLASGLFSVSCAVRSTEPAIETQYSFEGNPAVEILKQYQSIDNRVNIVNPYIVNLMALDLLDRQSFRDLIRAYIDWYLGHLNYPDKYGITGSIYDYRVFTDGREEPLNSMDSIDSYAATFIMLVQRYYEKHGDRALVSDNEPQLQDIIYLVPYLQQSDGLTAALPRTTGKYLMDNCEAYGGITAFLNLAAEFGWSIRSFYAERQTILRRAIENHLYDGVRGYYSWLKDGDTVFTSDLSKFYPDAFAQLFPILYNIGTSPDRKKHLWDLFHQYHGSALSGIPAEQQIIYRWTRDVMLDSYRVNDRNVQTMKEKKDLEK